MCLNPQPTSLQKKSKCPAGCCSLSARRRQKQHSGSIACRGVRQRSWLNPAYACAACLCLQLLQQHYGHQDEGQPRRLSSSSKWQVSWWGGGPRGARTHLVLRIVMIIILITGIMMTTLLFMLRRLRACHPAPSPGGQDP